MSRVSRLPHAVVLSWLALGALAAGGCAEPTAGGTRDVTTTGADVQVTAGDTATAGGDAAGGDAAAPDVASLGESWITAAGSHNGAPFQFAARASVFGDEADLMASSGNGQGLGFSIYLSFAGAEAGTTCTHCLGLTHDGRDGHPSAITPVDGGIVTFTAIGGPGGYVTGTFTLALDQPENATFPAIAMTASGAFQLLRKP